MNKKTEITIIAGAGYSDEGKGHVVQLLSKESKYDIVMRCNGSWSSSHRIKKNITCNHLPSVLDENITLIVNNGMFINPFVLLEELKDENRKNQKIYIHEECFVIDNLNVDKNSTIGTLGSGVRLASIKKLNHESIKLKEFIDLNSEFNELKNYLISDEQYFALTFGKNILVEGSHGYLIDCNFGEYPYTTSTQTTASSIMGLTKYGSETHKETIFVSGLILLSLSIHPSHKTFDYYNIKDIDDIISNEIKIDFACGSNMQRNIGPLDLDKLINVIKYYPECKIYFTFYDIIYNYGNFYYILDNKLLNIEKKLQNYEEFKKSISNFIENILSRKIYLCDPPNY